MLGTWNNGETIDVTKQIWNSYNYYPSPVEWSLLKSIAS